LRVRFVEAGAQVGAVWNGEVIPPASGMKQIHKLLDSLAGLPDAPGPSLGETLRHPACRGFRDGLQIVVATDVGLARLPRLAPEEERHWVVLRSSAFGGSSAVESAYSAVRSGNRPMTASTSARHCARMESGRRC
jgi:uncharacterized protein (DUF58 family)